MSRQTCWKIRAVLERLECGELNANAALVEIDDLVAEETGEEVVLPDDFDQSGIEEQLNEDEDEED